MMGIYCITNKINEIVYVGSSKRLLDRFSDHKRNLKNGRHENLHLQRAFKKYGLENFKYEILELVDNVDNLFEREEFWIREKEANDHKKGYNIIHYGKFSDFNINRKFKTTRYFVVSPIGETFDVGNLPDFCRQKNLSSNTMSKVAIGKFEQHKLWRCWKWEEKPKIIENQFNFQEIRTNRISNIARKNIEHRNNTQHKWIYEFTNIHSGEKIREKSVKKFCKNQNIDSKYMYQVVNNIRIEYKGWFGKKSPIL